MLLRLLSVASVRTCSAPCASPGRSGLDKSAPSMPTSIEAQQRSGRNVVSQLASTVEVPTPRQLRLITTALTVRRSAVANRNDTRRRWSIDVTRPGRQWKNREVTGLRALIRRLGAYTSIQLIGLLAPLLALPVVARSTDSSGWSALGIGQAIGTMAGLVILFGWWTIGPSEYAKCASEGDRHALYRRSVVERLILSGPVLLVACVAAALIADSSVIQLAVLSVLATANVGLSPNWYFIAKARPSKMAKYETAPRVIGSLTAVALVALTGEVLYYPVLLAVLPLVTYGIAFVRETPTPSAGWLSLRGIRTDLGRQFPIAGSNILGGLYSQLMTPFVAVLMPAILPAFISGDRLYKAGRFTITATGNTLQPWTLEQPTRRRHLSAISAHAALGLGGGLVAWLLMPTFSRLMFGPNLSVTYTLSMAFGIGFLCNSILTPLIRNLLVPMGRRWIPLIGTVLATVVAVGIVATLRGPLGSDALALAIAASEATCLVVAVVGTVPLIRRLR